jgi:hypothetical protein
MADNEIQDTEEISEPTIDQDEMDGFNSYGSGDADQDKEKDEDNPDSGEDGKDGDDKGDGTEGDGEDADKKDDKDGTGEEAETAEQKALKRAERFKDADKDDDKADARDKADEKKDVEDKGGKPSSITKEKVREYLDIIPDDDLPGEIILGDDTIDIKGLKEDFPEDYSAIKVLSAVMADKIVQKRISEGEFVKAGDIDKKVAPLEERMTRLSFWDEVRDAHADAKTIVKTKAFSEWIEKQPKSIQALGGTWDAQDAISVIDFYKEAQAKKTAKEHDDKQREEKKKKDGLHSAGMRSKPGTQKTDAKNDMSDEEAGFDEGLASLQR